MEFEFACVGKRSRKKERIIPDNVVNDEKYTLDHLATLEPIIQQKKKKKRERKLPVDVL